MSEKRVQDNYYPQGKVPWSFVLKVKIYDRKVNMIFKIEEMKKRNKSFS